MLKKPQILVLTVAALASLSAVAATDTEVMKSLIKLHVTTPKEVVDGTIAYESKLDEVSSALYSGKTEIDCVTNALVKLKALKTEVETDAQVKDEGLFGAVANVTGGTEVINNYVADTKRLYSSVKSTLLDSKLGKKRFSIASEEILKAKQRFAKVRMDIKKEMKKN